jgi:NADH:quinone reductase (non-electrogenic)
VKTAITELFGIEHPIIQGGMHFVGFAELAAAVSNAGGLGIITGLTQRTPELLAKEIARCRDMTDKPFGVNLTFLPTFAAPPYPEYIAAIVEGGIKAVETAGRSPEQYMPALKAAGIKVIHKCTSVRHGVSAEKIGVDAISMDGFECAGHPGEDDIPNLVLLPAAANVIKIPMLASGGFGDARGLVAALALGCEGINMGTRFMATKEAPIHDNVKQALVSSDERSTSLIFRTMRNTSRVYGNSIAKQAIAMEAEGKTIQEIGPIVSGAKGRIVYETGDLEHGVWSAGTCMGLINDIPSCRELVERIVGEAEAMIKGRLSQAVAA